MVAQAQCIGHKVTGLRLDASDVRRYFRKHISTVELHIGHLCIGCQLPPDFWQEAPVIGDSRLCEWLEAKQFNYLSPHSDLEWALIPEGNDIFKLEPACRPVKRQVKSVSIAARRQVA